MTVAELIDLLKDCSPDALVLIPHWNATGTFEDIGRVTGASTIFKQEPRRWCETAGEYMELDETMGHPNNYFVAVDAVRLTYD